MIANCLGDLQTYAFSDTEAKFNMADGYVFFEIVEPQESVSNDL